ncbi:CsbD family protein [Mangrovitalea sediminis]|uniref:CsbD family protein n=1 Tax=Mangrovitalea sediminis TaxID=1982043 RepID=UPI000BE504A3|nr:CsbD family protein [Mangrovitalea sediminis]
MTTVDEMKGKWKQQIGKAKLAWGKLTEDEILKSEGRAEKLQGLIQERYAITREEAEKQVNKFFEKEGS